MDSPDEQHLKQTIERLTHENARLRSQLAVTEQWNPPLDLEHTFRTAKGWQCITVPLIPEQPTLILIRGTEPGTQEDEAAAGEVWRHLQTAAPPGGRIGPFARARMPSRLLGYLREHGGRTIIVLNRDLRRGQVSRAARILRSNARMRHPRLLELSAIPLLGLCALSHGGSAKGVVGLGAAAAPTAHHRVVGGHCAVHEPLRGDSASPRPGTPHVLGHAEQQQGNSAAGPAAAAQDASREIANDARLIRDRPITRFGSDADLRPARRSS